MIKKAITMARYFGRLPEESKRFQTKKLRFLVRFCYQLQQLANPEPFYLSWNQAARALKVSAECAGDYLHTLVRDGIIEVVEEHTEIKATRYRYVADKKKGK